VAVGLILYAIFMSSSPATAASIPGRFGARVLREGRARTG
jgi:hypothetical protein